jgi:hypothetical protein
LSTLSTEDSKFKQKTPFLKALKERRNFDIYSASSWVKAGDTSVNMKKGKVEKE